MTNRVGVEIVDKSGLRYFHLRVDNKKGGSGTVFLAAAPTSLKDPDSRLALVVADALELPFEVAETVVVRASTRR